MSQGPGAHSPVGGSAIKRIMECEASVTLADGLEDEESDHAKLGTAVHSLIETCFKLDIDAWTQIGSTEFDEDLPVTKEMADSAQVMLNAVRQAHPDRNQGNFWVERRFHCPTIHRLFFGTSDVVYLDRGFDEHGDQMWTLHIWDYKNGVTLVEATDNAQGKYYACGALEDLMLWDKVDLVVIHIVQPNGFHLDGPVRHWSTDTEDLTIWLEDELIPGIEKALKPGPKKVVSGDHCRFCPVRFAACPALMLDIKELQDMIEIIEAKGADALTDEFVAQLLDLDVKAKIAVAAAKKTALGRAMSGHKIPGWKLMHGKTDRVWQEGAEAKAKQEFGDLAYTTPELKSPAQIDKLPLGKTFTARNAFMPQGGLRLGRESEAGAEVSSDTKSLFKPLTKGNLTLVKSA